MTSNYLRADLRQCYNNDTNKRTESEDNKVEYINSFVYCDKVTNEVNPANNTVNRNIVSPLNELRPINIPGNYTFSVSCGISGIDPATENHISFRFIYPSDNKEISLIEATIPNNSLLVEAGQQYSNLNLDVEYRNLVLNAEGTYKMEVELNNKKLGEYFIEVKKAVIYYANER